MHLLQCCSHRTSRGVCNDAGLSIWLLETAEIFLGAFCSVVTWRFTVQSESVRLPGPAFINLLTGCVAP